MEGSWSLQKITDPGGPETSHILTNPEKCSKIKKTYMKDGKEDKKSINDERNDVGECRKRECHCNCMSENIGT